MMYDYEGNEDDSSNGRRTMAKWIAFEEIGVPLGDEGFTAGSFSGGVNVHRGEITGLVVECSRRDGSKWKIITHSVAKGTWLWARLTTAILADENLSAEIEAERAEWRPREVGIGMPIRIDARIG